MDHVLVQTHGSVHSLSQTTMTGSVSSILRRAQYILPLTRTKTNAVPRPNERPTPLCSCRLYIRTLLETALQYLHHHFTRFKISRFGFGLLISLYSLTRNWTHYRLYNHLLPLFCNMTSQGAWYHLRISSFSLGQPRHNKILIISIESGYRQKLNNELQRIGDLPNLRYEFATVGPLHQATWTATATSTSQSKETPGYTLKPLSSLGFRLWNRSWKYKSRRERSCSRSRLQETTRTTITNTDEQIWRDGGWHPMRHPASFAILCRIPPRPATQSFLRYSLIITYITSSLCNSSLIRM